MKGFSKLLLMLTICLIFVQTPMLVFAAEQQAGDTQEIQHYDTGNAVTDILRNGRFEGAISSIQVITDFIDIWFIRVISIVSFFIISAAMLKNVCAGAYCANSKFWDKVDDAHKKSEAISLAQVGQYFKGGGWQNTSAGSLKDFVFGIIPNIKGITEFEDADIEPKAYFMKSIPQMIACVCIGIFIYNGYYRDTAAQVGQMGSVIIDKTLNSVDPESLVNSVFNSTSWPDFPWKGDPTTEGKTYQQLANSIKALINSNYSGIQTAQAKAIVAQNIAQRIQDECKPVLGELFVDSEYMYNITGTKAYVSVESGNYPKGTCKLISGNAEVWTSDRTYMYAVDLNSIVSGTTTDMSNETAVGYISFTMKIEVNDGTGGPSGQTAESLQYQSSYSQSSPVQVPNGVDKTMDATARTCTFKQGFDLPITSLNIISSKDGSPVTNITNFRPSIEGGGSYSRSSTNSITINANVAFALQEGNGVTTIVLGTAIVNGSHKVPVIMQLGGGGQQQQQPGT